MFELTQVKANKYTDDCCCRAEKQNLISDAYLQRQLDHKIDGELKYAYSNLCAPVPNITPLYWLLSLLMAAELLGQDAAEILKVYSNLKRK